MQSDVREFYIFWVTPMIGSCLKELPWQFGTMISSVGSLHSTHSGTEGLRNPSVHVDRDAVVSVAHKLKQEKMQDMKQVSH